MPSKRTGPERQKRLRDRRIAAGYTYASFWVPTDFLAECRELIRLKSIEHERARYPLFADRPGAAND